MAQPVTRWSRPTTSSRSAARTGLISIGAPGVVTLDPAVDKDLPLREDIRLLGRLLGDTLREQEGEDTFQLIEQIRQTAIRFRRDADDQARGELESLLDLLSPAATVAVIFALGFAGLAWSFYPFVVPDRLTIWQAAAGTESLAVILVGTAVVLPIIVGSTFYAYRVFAGKAGDLSYD